MLNFVTLILYINFLWFIVLSFIIFIGKLTFFEDPLSRQDSFQGVGSSNVQTESPSPLVFKGVFVALPHLKAKFLYTIPICGTEVQPLQLLWVEQCRIYFSTNLLFARSF